jgi:DNA-binding NarL/FixJ family response regulator
LVLLALGKTNRQIAKEMLVSVSTVKAYVGRVIEKLGVSDRTQAAVRAVELGLLSEKRQQH